MLIASLFVGAVALAASVTPVPDYDWPAGNATDECERANGCGDFALKIDEWGSNMDGDYSDPQGEPGKAAANVITIYDSDGQTFSWESEYEVCTVIVKGGPAANSYSYPYGSGGDTGLVAPINRKDNDNDGSFDEDPVDGVDNDGDGETDEDGPETDTYDISHVSFCWNDLLCDDNGEKCWQEETAWAAGSRYVSKGNWATYTPYPGDGQSVEIYAGKNMLAGTATFSNNGDGTVDIEITLEDGFIFYYDLNDPNNDDDNIKIQDYDAAPSGNPAPGLFDNKFAALVYSTSYTVTVPENDYYGIHLDVAYEVDCE
jgi:hypothetical protein